MIKVSVIVPAYNASKYIRKCLDSLVNQTLKDIEIIVVNDGSSDNTLEVLQEYKGKIVIINQRNKGVATARNVGIGKAKGEYIGFVDSDDYVDEKMFEELFNKAVSNNYDIACCDFKYFNDNKMWNGIVDLKSNITCLNDKKRYMVNMFPVIWNKIYKSNKIKNIKFKDGVWAEDVEFLYRVVTKIDTVGKVNQQLYYYYQRENSESRLFDARVYNYVDNFNGLYNYYKENNLMNPYKFEFEYCYVRYLYATFIKRAASFKDKNEFNNAINIALKNVKEKFPNYKKNKYFYNNFKGIYLIMFNRFIANLYYDLVNR